MDPLLGRTGNRVNESGTEKTPGLQPTSFFLTALENTSKPQTLC